MKRLLALAVGILLLVSVSAQGLPFYPYKQVPETLAAGGVAMWSDLQQGFEAGSSSECFWATVEVELVYIQLCAAAYEGALATASTLAAAYAVALYRQAVACNQP